jgi:hypothetical protein
MDQRQLNIALSLFEAFRSNLKSPIVEAEVKEYNSLVQSIALAIGENLEVFLAPMSEMKTRITGSRPRSYSGHPGRISHSSQAFFDGARFARLVEGLAVYLEKQGYQSQKIPPTSPRASATHSVHIENMFGSAVQQGSHGSTIDLRADFRHADFAKFISNLRDSVEGLDVDTEKKNELYSDIGTMEVQAKSPNPKPSIIVACLTSIRTILTTAATSVAVTSLLAEIRRYLPL